jgi:hypothetical protein
MKNTNNNNNNNTNNTNNSREALLFGSKIGLRPKVTGEVVRPVKYGAKVGLPTGESRFKEKLTPDDFLLRVHDEHGVKWKELAWLHRSLLTRSNIRVLARFAGVLLVVQVDKFGNTVEYYRCYAPKEEWDDDPPHWAK